MNTIGSADAMVIGHETPISIALRRMIHADSAMHNDILGPARMPTLAQYYPWQKHLEIQDGELLITSDGAIPLVRYSIHDKAKLFSYKEMQAALKVHGVRAPVEALPVEIREQYNWKLPFILLYGKSTNAVKLYGANVYPENIKAALEAPKLSSLFTGKFKMQVFYDAHQDQRLRLFIELSPGVGARDVNLRELQQTIILTACNLNSEFKSSFIGSSKKMTPLIKLVPYGYFDLNEAQNKHDYV